MPLRFSIRDLLWLMLVVATKNGRKRISSRARDGTATGRTFIRPNITNGVSPSEPIGSEPCDSI